MRKSIVIFYFILLITSLFIGCSEKKKFAKTDNDLKSFTYDLDNVTSFTVGNDGKLYATTNDDSMLHCFNVSGNLIKTYEIGMGRNTNLCMEGNYIYCFTYQDIGVVIKQINLVTGIVNEYKMENDIKSIVKMEVIEDNIYYTRWSDNHDEEQEQVRYDEHDDYYYFGEQAGVYNLNTQIATPLDIKNVILFTKINKNELLFYAYDDIGGYYFVNYDIKQQQFGNKAYNNDIGYTFSFAYDSQSDMIFYSKFNNRRLYVTRQQDASVKAEIMTDVCATSGNDLTYMNGYTYILDNRSQKVYSNDNGKILKENKALKMYSPSFYRESPLGCGYNINAEIISEESFVLTVLAGDADYDFSIMSSTYDFSRSLRDKEAFYPLEDVPGVMEYLDSCFPYVKEAATSSSGSIWMIPIAVDANCIVYHEDNCRAEGIDIKSADSIQKLEDIAKKIYLNPKNRDRYSLNGYQLQGNVIDQYVDFYALQNNKANFNTELFRGICTMLKEDIDVTTEELHTWIYSPNSIEPGSYYNNFLFELLMYKFSMYEENAYQVLSARPVPSIDANVVNPNSIDCLYICVNPYSDNLESTLNYISDLCNILSTRMDTYMLQELQYYSYMDSKLTKDLYDIYSNGIVTFPLSKEIFWNDYLSYQKGDMDINGFIMEIERKTNAYLRE